MKKIIAALCILVFLKAVTTNSTSATPFFNNYADTARPKVIKPLRDSTSVEDSTIVAADTTGNGSSKSVHVKGYYRKDGKYVAPYTRSAPRKKN